MALDKAVLLAELRSLIDQMPSFDTYTPTSAQHLRWIGRVDALLQRWNPMDSIPFRTSVSFLGLGRLDTQLGGMLAVVHRAIADLELDVPAATAKSFGPGAVYDFSKSLRTLIATARQSLLIVDPYLDAQSFDAYVSDVGKIVHVRLLAKQLAQSLKPAVEAFRSQSGMRVEVRASQSLHDRIILIDDLSCWVLGQSIKDAAKSKPTYLAPLPADAAALKRAAYETIWANASPVT